MVNSQLLFLPVHLEWLKELSNVNFDSLVRRHTNLQNDLIQILGLDDAGFMFEGYIELKDDEVYTFFTESDDGSQLF